MPFVPLKVHGVSFKVSTQNSNCYKCLPAIDKADKVIHGSSEASVSRCHETSEVLANSMSQSHCWVNFLASSL